MTGPVRLVDDDADLREVLTQTLTLAGLSVEPFADAAAALAGLDGDYPGIVLSDVRMPGMDGLQLFAHLRGLDPDLPVILLTGHGDVAMAVAALHQGAYDFLTKPVAADRLTASVRRALSARALVLENRRLARRAGQEAARIEPALMGDSPAMIHLRDSLDRLAEAQSDALILGPSGAGKSVAARAIHRLGGRRSRALMVLDCAAVDEAGFEALLLGGQPPRGPRRPGLLEQVHRGILCLEDVTALPAPLQARLLGLVEAGEYWPAGAAAPRPLSVQILATATEDPRPAMHPGLYFRLSRAVLRLPPLADRREDIPALFRHYLQAAADRLSRQVPPLTDLVLARLAAHGWPGNLRELQAFAEAHVLGLTPWDGPGDATDRPALPDLVAAYEAGLIREALRHTGGNATGAMALLQVPRKTFYDKLTRHGIRPGDYRD